MDRETYLDRLGVDLEPGGRQPAPLPLRVVQRFVNSHNHELEMARDRLGSPEKATRWLVGISLLETGDEALTAEDTTRLRQGREVIRALAAHAPLPGELSDDELEVPVRLRAGAAGGSGLAIEASGKGADRILGTLFAIVHEAMLDGSWQRMKLCRQCSWLFFDQSRNRSGGWCSMAVCGNRAKNRSYRHRAGV